MPALAAGVEARQVVNRRGSVYCLALESCVLGVRRARQILQEYSMSSDSSDLRRAGLKATLPRLNILAVLERESESHLSAEDVYRALMETGDDVGLATVYRVLTQFEAAGLVIRHNFAEGRAVFELDSGDHHDHIVCVDCGAVTEFVDATIERRQHKIADDHDFDIADHSMVIYGHCRRTKCPNRSSK
jgi:Fur family ferric uptake transcriptional regulator